MQLPTTLAGISVAAFVAAAALARGGDQRPAPRRPRDAGIGHPPHASRLPEAWHRFDRATSRRWAEAHPHAAAAAQRWLAAVLGSAGATDLPTRSPGTTWQVEQHRPIADRPLPR